LPNNDFLPKPSLQNGIQNKNFCYNAINAQHIEIILCLWYNGVMKNIKKNSKYLARGMSLVELSIVMVIIGLLIGAVVGGLSVKKSSELRSIITQIDQFRVAISGFQDKYGDLPGDMPDAHSYWDNGSNTVCGTSAECNGNGNGAIEFQSSNTDNENIRFLL
jgi:prepilin-type N-terminal cleavage/methylation domain-containing protein